jgi:putative ABC transport system permease protein
VKFLPWILKHLRRDAWRTFSTMLALALGVFLFCTLRTIVDAVSFNLDNAASARLVTRSALGLASQIPVAYSARIGSVPGVRTVAIANNFLGIYQSFRNFFPNLAVQAEPYLSLYPEYVLSADDKQAFLQDRRGCVIGEKLATRFQWKRGDVVHLESLLGPYRKPDGAFELIVRGIYTPDRAKAPGADGSQLLFHYEYLREALPIPIGVTTYVVGIEDPARAGDVSKSIDALFDNSNARTRTETEAAFRAGFVSILGGLSFLLRTIGVGVAFTLFIISANTMSMAARERTKEVAVMKCLGFSPRLVMSLFLSESILIAGCAGAVGVLAARQAVRSLPDMLMIGDAVRGFPDLNLSLPVSAIAIATALLVGLASGLLPALGAYRLNICDGLRRI